MPEGPGRLEGQADGDHAHVLYAAGHHQVLQPGHDAHRREAHGLLPRTALAVDGRTRDRLRQTGGQPRSACDVARLGAEGVHAPEDHVLDGHGVHVVARQDLLDHVCPHVGGMHLGQAAAPLARGRADGIDDVGLGHGISWWIWGT